MKPARCIPADESECVRGHIPTIVCPFCDHRIKSSERVVRRKAVDEPPSVQVVRCRNCGEVFEMELELPEEEHDTDFF